MLIKHNFYLPNHLQKIIFPLPEFEKVIKKHIKLAKAQIQENCILEYYKEELSLIEEITTKINSCYKQAIIIGVGGATASSRPYVHYHDFHSTKFKLLYSDNISLAQQTKIFTKNNLKKSAIIVISRSGESVETLAQVSNIIKKYQIFFDKNYDIGKHFFIIANGENTLQNIAKSINANFFNYNCKSGKFSAFSTPGLLPAKLINLNPEKILNGAFEALKQAEKAFESAWVNFNLMQLGYNINILSHYDNRYAELLKWFSQITSEITGKNGKGSASIVTGINDQHSSWQLFIAGPKDKYFTLFTDENHKKDKSYAALIGREYYKLNKESLITNNMPIREIIFSKATDESFGFLMMSLLLEAVILANLMNITPITHPEIERQKETLSKLFASKFDNYFKQKL